MAYSQTDIYMGTSGDFVVDSKGDLTLAESFESVKQSVNFIARTDKGDFVPDERLGGDLGTFVGDTLDEDILVNMERSLISNLERFILNRGDFQVHCMPISTTDVGVFIVVAGQYLDKDGNILDTQQEVVSFTYPYAEGEASIP